MPTYEIEIGGKTYEAEAANPDTAFRNAQIHHTGMQQGQAVSGPALASAAVSGLPVIGALEPTAGATFQAATQPWLGLGSDAPTYEQRRAENIARHQARQETFKQQNPNEALAAQVGGGMLGMGLLPPELLGLKALPEVTGPVLQILQRMSLGSATGGAVSAADAAARGQPVGPAANLGAVVGAAVPFASSAFGNTAQALAANHPDIFKNIAGGAAPLLGSLLGIHLSPEPVSGAGIGSILGWGARSGSEKLADWITGRIARSVPAESLGSLAAWPYAVAPAVANRFQNQPSIQTPYGAQ